MLLYRKQTQLLTKGVSGFIFKNKECATAKTNTSNFCSSGKSDVNSSSDYGPLPLCMGHILNVFASFF